jgi:chromosome segregation ATPase
MEEIESKKTQKASLEEENRILSVDIKKLKEVNDILKEACSKITSKIQQIGTHIEEIEITISANVPPKSVNPAAIIKFQPVLKSVNGDLQLKEMILGGEKVTESVDVKLKRRKNEIIAVEHNHNCGRL